MLAPVIPPRPMLRLLQSPTWLTDDGSAAALLPCTLPSALAIHLAAQRGFVDRERAACLFWPDRAPAEALHNLRVNLHRLRSQLKGWNRGEALQAERQRIALSLPTDLHSLDDAIVRTDVQALLVLRPWRLLEGFRLAGFEAFHEWAESERSRLTRAWSAACERALAAALRAADAGATPLFGAWHEQGLCTPQALARLRAEAGGDAAEALWRQWQASAHGVSPARLPATALAPHGAGASALCGREAEQHSLRGQRSAAVLVAGEPGVGKTTLVTSTFPGRPLMRGREGLEAVPFGPLAELLRREAGWLAEPSAYRLDLARLLPELAGDETLPPLDAHTAKLRLLEGLAQVVERHAALLLVDDLQWCDPATLEWLVFVAHRGNLRWVATARSHQMSQPARQALQALRSANLLSETSLAGLDAAGLAALCRSRWPLQDWPDTRIQALLQRCGGNPFFVGELVAAGLDGATVATLPQRSGELVRQRLRGLGAAAQAVLEVAAVLARPVPLAMLAATCGRDKPEALADCVAGCEEALAAGLLSEAGGAIECRHDLIRSAVHAGLSTPRRQWLHRRAALALAPVGEPLVLAQHWEAAGEPQTALTWHQRGAFQLKDQGRLDEARALWRRISAEASDPALALHARLALAECELYDDLEAGRAALEAVLAQTAAIADPLVHDQLEAQALAGLVDNRVFAGDQPSARVLARQLRPLLPRLGIDERVHAIEVLIELAMREPDIDDALALLAQARRLRPKRAALLSFEGQIHWFGGKVREARAAFERMLEEHPQYCSGLTIENDLAVMCHALGDLQAGETMARRSLASWKGVAHTETLSLLVLASTLTSGGRYDEAGAALDQAEALARRQSSQLFVSEVHSRRARLLACCGRYDDALAQIERAAPLVRDDDNPLRLSQLLVQHAICLAASGRMLEESLRSRLQSACWRSAHALVHARLARVEIEFALAAGDAGHAAAAAERMTAIARDAGLQEVLAEALLLQLRAADSASTPLIDRLALAREAALLAETQGYRDLAWRASSWLARSTRDTAWDERAHAALAALKNAAQAIRFDAALAARREPRG